MKPRLLDLFCGAGGAAMGYHRAGFDVVGVDIKPQKHYPFEFHQADAMTYPLDGFDVIHASPPCQAYSMTRNLWKEKDDSCYVDLVEPVRTRLVESRIPYVIENVVGAPLIAPIMLCGSSFGLDVRRHRLFELPFYIFMPECAHHWQTPRFETQISNTRAKVRKPRTRRVISVAGHDTAFYYSSSVVHVMGNGGGKGGGIDLWQQAMGIDWMSRNELSQAIPPAYTEFIGKQLMSQL